MFEKLCAKKISEKIYTYNLKFITSSFSLLSFFCICIVLYFIVIFFRFSLLLSFYLRIFIFLFFLSRLVFLFITKMCIRSEGYTFHCTYRIYLKHIQRIFISHGEKIKHIHGCVNSYITIFFWLIVKLSLIYYFIQCYFSI